MDPNEVGLFANLIIFHTWIFIFAEGFALQNIIQFGAIDENRPKVNFIALVLYIATTGALTGLFVLFSKPIAMAFSEPRIAEVASTLPWLILVTLPRMYSIKMFYRDHEMNKLFLSNLFFFGPMIIMTFILIPIKKELVFGDIANIYMTGSLMSSIVCILIAWKKYKLSIHGEITWKKALNFSFPYMLANAIYSLPRYLDKILIQVFFETRVLGIYEAAKNLFRVFEEVTNAGNGLIYPAAVRIIERKDKEALNQMVSKGISFLWVSFLMAFVILQLGGTDLIIKFFLNAKYFNSIGQFKVLLIALFFQPFTTLFPIMTASSRYYVLLRIVAVSTTVGLITYIIIGMLGSELFIPLGNVVSLGVLGITTLFYLKKENLIEFGWRDLLRAFSDSRHFINTKVGKQRKV